MSASEPGGGNAAATPGAEGLLDAVKFGPDGLVTAVAVDDRDLSGRARPITQAAAEVWARRAPSDLDP